VLTVVTILLVAAALAPVVISKLGKNSASQARVAGGGSPQGAKQQRIIRLAGVTASFYLPLMVAHDENLFKAYGFSSDIRLFNNNNDMMNALLHGDADVSALGSGGAFALEAQSPGRVKFIYGQNNRSYSILVRSNSNISSLEALRGKKIGTWPSPTPPVLLHLLLDKPTSKSFEIVPIEFRFMNQALKNGDVDALLNTDVFTQQAVDSKIAKFLSKYPLEEYVMNPFFNGGGLILSDIDRTSPEMSRAIRAGLADAITIINKRPEVARRALVRNLGVSQAVANAAPVDEFVLNSEVDLAKAQSVADMFQHAGVLSAPINVKLMFSEGR
jgi:ABC-type nitrate/sulfonate/bicarbonate transport system substrate-binding protein